MVNDPIGDMIARIRNAQMRSKSKVSMPGSKQRERVLEVLKTEGFIRGYASVAHASGRSELEIELKYFDGEPVIREIERISKPGRRVYVAVRNLPRINNGLGVAILSTPKGVMADHEAREANVGGEIICTVFGCHASAKKQSQSRPALPPTARGRPSRSRGRRAPCRSSCMTIFRSPWTRARSSSSRAVRASAHVRCGALRGLWSRTSCRA